MERGTKEDEKWRWVRVRDCGGRKGSGKINQAGIRTDTDHECASGACDSEIILCPFSLLLPSPSKS